MSKTGFPGRRAARARRHADAAQRGQRDEHDPRAAGRAVAEVPDWQELRDAGAAIKARVMATLPEQLERLEASVSARAAGALGA